jgi:hypothetical protein
VHQRRRLGAGVPPQGLGEGGVDRVVVDGPPDGDGDPSTRSQDPPGLAHGQRLVGAVLQALLAADDVEGAAGQGQGGDGAAGPGPGGGQAGHDPGAAGHVEHAVAGLDRDQVEEPLGARGEQDRDEVSLVGGRCLGLELESLGHGHSPLARGCWHPPVVAGAGSGREERRLGLGGRKPRAVLAALLLSDGRQVRTDALVDALWGDAAPASTGTEPQLTSPR